MIFVSGKPQKSPLALTWRTFPGFLGLLGFPGCSGFTGQRSQGIVLNAFWDGPTKSQKGLIKAAKPTTALMKPLRFSLEP